MGKCSHSMASGTLERCSLHGWIPVFTVQGRWQTARMASCGWAVCWCQRCGSSSPWWRWGYGMSRRMLWTMNTRAFYWWYFECTEIPWRDPEAHCCAIHPQPLPCHPLSIFGMLWIGVYDSVFQFLPISSNFTQPLKRSGPTFHRPHLTTWSTLCEGDVANGKWWSHQILTGFRIPPPPTPQYSKTAHFTFTFSHLADAFIQSNLQLWST